MDLREEKEVPMKESNQTRKRGDQELPINSRLERNGNDKGHSNHTMPKSKCHY
jgi:hypothetical protein